MHTPLQPHPLLLAYFTRSPAIDRYPKKDLLDFLAEEQYVDVHKDVTPETGLGILRSCSYPSPFRLSCGGFSQHRRSNEASRLPARPGHADFCHQHPYPLRQRRRRAYASQDSASATAVPDLLPVLLRDHQGSLYWAVHYGGELESTEEIPWSCSPLVSEDNG